MQTKKIPEKQMKAILLFEVIRLTNAHQSNQKKGHKLIKPETKEYYSMDPGDH